MLATIPFKQNAHLIQQHMLTLPFFVCGWLSINQSINRTTATRKTATMLLRAPLAALSRSAMASQRLRVLAEIVTTIPVHAQVPVGMQQQQRAFSQQKSHAGKKKSAAKGAIAPRHRAIAAGAGKMDLYFQRDSEQKEHRERFQQQSARAQRWMEFRAAAGDYAALVKSVADSYEPLFRTHPALVGSVCPLNELLAKTVATGSEDFEDDYEAGDEEIELARGERPTGPRQVLPRYQEGRTKMMEQLALGFLFKGRQNELAVAVYENRRFISETIAASGLAQNDRERRMVHEHYRSFYSLATGAYAALNNHKMVVQVYEDLMASKQLWPTVAMNVNYVRALAVLRRYEDVERAYRQISASDGFQNVFFYRCMLFYVGASRNTGVLQDVRAKMLELRFELRPVDYMHCMRAFDGLYYYTSNIITSDHQPQVPAMPTSYVDYLALQNSDDESQDEATNARVQEGARGALAIFDELLNRNKDAKKNSVLIPEDLGKPLYTRVLTAAIKLGDHERVASIVAIRRQRGNAPLCEDALPLAVTGLLLGDQPEEAWRLVQEEYEHTSPRPRVHTAIVGNLLGYLTIHQTHNFLILKILDDFKRRAAVAPATVPNLHVRVVIDTLCADRELLDDKQLYEVVTSHNAVFKVTSQPFWFANFLTSCHEHQRLAAAKSAFQARNLQEIPTIPVALAISLMKSYSELGDFEFVHRLYQAVKLLTKTDRCEVCYLAIRACAQVEWLGEDAIREIYETYLTQQQGLELPDDIKTLLQL